MNNRFAFLDHPGVTPFAHRGGTSSWPENTMPAFQHSVDLGYRYLETDVHLSADGVLFAFHDSNLARTTGHNEEIGDLTSHEIESLLVDGRARVPRIEEITSTWPHAMVNIDPKSDAAVEPLAAFITQHRLVDRVCVGSSSDRRVQLMRKLIGPELCTSMGNREALHLRAVSQGLADPANMKAPCAQLPVTVYGKQFLDRRLVEAAHECNIRVHVWTIDEPAEMLDLLAIGVDGIMTDRPEILRSVLIEQDQWRLPGDPHDRTNHPS